MEILLISALLVLILVAFFGRALLNQQCNEGFVSYLLAPADRHKGIEGTAAGTEGLAAFPNGQQAILDRTLDVGLGNLGAASCAAIDQSRDLELGGQFVQRTNNYRREYPDNCSAPLTEFVGSIYKEKLDVGLGVPCKGSC